MSQDFDGLQRGATQRRPEAADHPARPGLPADDAVHVVRRGGGEDRHRRRNAAARRSPGRDAGRHELRRRFRRAAGSKRSSMARSTARATCSSGGFLGLARQDRAPSALPAAPRPAACICARAQTGSLRFAALVNHQPVRDEPVQVQNGKLSVQLFLSDTSAETLKQLQQLGFEIVLQPRVGQGDGRPNRRGEVDGAGPARGRKIHRAPSRELARAPLRSKSRPLEKLASPPAFKVNTGHRHAIL